MRYALAIVLVLVLPGCAIRTGIVEIETIDTVCVLAWKPVGWSVRDTDQTIYEVKQNNARRKAFCR